MKTHISFHRFLSLVTLLVLLLSLSPSPSLLARQEPQPATAGGLMGPTADTSAPATVTNLVASTGISPGTVELSWIAPGDDATAGTASVYIVRYNTNTITESNWGTSSSVIGEPVPGPAGSIESMTVSGLTQGQRYYFAIKTQDEVPNTSGISNSSQAVANSSNTIYLPLVASAASTVPAVIPDTTEVLPETTTQYLSEVSGDGAVFTFTQSTADLNALAPGDVMVGDTTASAPYGFLRQVTSVSSAGDQVIITTEAATLEDAIESGAAHISRVLTPDDIQGGMQMQGVTLAAAQLQDEFYFTLEDVVLYDNDGNLDTKDDQITANGSIRVEPSFDFGLDVRHFQLEELYFTTSVKETAELGINGEVELLSVEEEKEIARHYFNPITVMIGPVPVVILSVLTVYVGVDGSVHVGVTTGVTQEAELTAGLQYADDIWSPVSDFSNQFYYNPPILSADLDLKGYAGAQLSLLLYGMVGPYAEVNAYLELEADVSETPWWSLYGGLEVPVGVKVEVLGHSIANYEAVPISYTLLLAQAQSNSPPNLPTNPSPVDGAADQSLDVGLSWAGGDLDGDTVTYDVYFEADDNTPDVLVSNDQPGTTYDPGTLIPSTCYYWRVVARDERGATIGGLVWDFATITPSPDVFYDDFNDGDDDGWGREYGNWVVLDGEYTATGEPGTPMSSILGYNSTDFAFDGDLRITSEGAAQLGLRVQGLSNTGNSHLENGILLVVFPGGNSIYWHVIVDGVGSPQNIQPLGITPSVDQPLHIRVEVSGDTYKAYVNGTLKNTLTDPTYHSGQVVLGINLGYPTPTTWDNIQVVPEL